MHKSLKSSVVVIAAAALSLGIVVPAGAWQNSPNKSAPYVIPAADAPLEEDVETLVQSVLPDRRPDVSADIDELFEVSVEELQSATIDEVQEARNLEEDGFLYGSSDYPVSMDSIAIAAVGVNPFSSDLDGIAITRRVPIKDAIGNVAYVGYTVKGVDSGEIDVLIAAHTRVPLVREIDPGSLADECEYTLLELYGLVCENSDAYTIINSSRMRVFNDYSQIISSERKRLLMSDRSVLNEIELENMVSLNNLAKFSVVDLEAMVLAKTYAGQDKDGGYGGISSPAAYLKDRYGGTWTRTDGETLVMPSFTMTSIDDLAPSSGHCIPTAITRGFAHARNKKGFKKITAGDQSLFKKVKSVAVKNGFKEGACATCGTAPNKIEGMIEKVGDDQGYPKTDAKWIGVFTWKNTVKSSISEGNPMILTFVSGYYGAHGVSVAGWAEYKSAANGRVAKMVAVWDGWKGSMRWVDWDAFTGEQTVGKSNNFSLASFYPIIVK
ncbi:hypothetical protein ACFSYH_12925 [Populibacterium corticicola]|uniref:Peptidase C39-like domain-containing protein n=1 Tax=Populibacterium corticicola TaxID=1812826 RepID=A0ABW5XH77_9MICO